MHRCRYAFWRVNKSNEYSPITKCNARGKGCSREATYTRGDVAVDKNRKNRQKNKEYYRFIPSDRRSAVTKCPTTQLGRTKKRKKKEEKQARTKQARDNGWAFLYGLSKDKSPPDTGSKAAQKRRWRDQLRPPPSPRGAPSSCCAGTWSAAAVADNYEYSGGARCLLTEAWLGRPVSFMCGITDPPIHPSALTPPLTTATTFWVKLFVIRIFLSFLEELSLNFLTTNNF